MTASYPESRHLTIASPGLALDLPHHRTVPMTASHPESRHLTIASPGLVLDLPPKGRAPRMTDCHPESQHLNAPAGLPLNHPAHG